MKKTLFIIVANVIVAVLLFTVAECFLRLRPKLNAARADWLVPDPGLGYKLNPLNDNVNSLGIRHAEIPAEKAKDRFRVLVLGDSVAWPKDGFVAMLRAHYDASDDGRAEVINAAIPGYTTFQERMLLERDLLGVRPDLVILQYCLNDNHRFLHELDAGGRWLITQEAKNAMFPGGDGWVSGLMRSSYLITKMRIRILSISSRPRSTFPWMDEPAFAAAWQVGTWDDTRKHILAIRDVLKKADAQFVLVAVPYEPQLRQDLLKLDNQFTTSPQRMLEDISRNLEVPFLDLHPVFVANGDKRLFTDGIHLTDDGHKLVTAQLVQFLASQHLGPVPKTTPQR
jgi:lysophospholipase L1-like esterase